jgi:catechol 2,3-dioxygenase-like lactoylglutathione lyase family enzyme
MPNTAQTTAIVAAMLPVTDLTRSARWYADLLGYRYFREFTDAAGVVTGCAVADPQTRHLISFRLRSAIAGQPDPTGEHPIILAVPDRAAVDAIQARAEALGLAPERGENTDIAYVEIADPDGIVLRVGVVLIESPAFTGVRFDGQGGAEFYDQPRLDVH